LALRVSPGGTRSWFAAYSQPGTGARLKLALGTYPTMGLAAARKAALDVRAKVKAGIDPGARAEPVSTVTVADLVATYLARHASTKRSGREIARRLNKNVVGIIGGIKLANLHRRDLTRTIDLIVDRGAGTEATRTFQDLRACIRWAVGRGDLDRNLCEGMKLPHTAPPRERVLTPDEIRTMWQALAAAPMMESSRNVIRLCLVTAQRVGEVAGMRRDELDLAARLWTLPPARTKNATAHAVPLSDLAVEIITAQLALADAHAQRMGYPLSPFVFPGPRGGALKGAGLPHAVQRKGKGAAEERKTLGIRHWTPHDLRRTAATGMEELGISPFVVAHVLNHISITKGTVTSKHYARHSYEAEKRAALDAWAGRLGDIFFEGTS